MKPTSQKKDLALKLLEVGSIFLRLDPRGADVLVPTGFKNQEELVLQFGLNMRVPIRDLDVTDEGITGTLSFSRRPFWCSIPWSAIFSMYSEEEKKEYSWGPRPVPAPAPKRSHLRAVGKDEAEPAPTPIFGRTGRGDAPTEEEHEGEDVDGACRQCQAPWPGGMSSCVVCGATHEEAFFVPGSGASPAEGGDLEDGVRAAQAGAAKTGPAERGASAQAGAPTGEPQGRRALLESVRNEAPEPREAAPQAQLALAAEDPPDPTPPSDPPPKHPHLRLVK